MKSIRSIVAVLAVTALSAAVGLAQEHASPPTIQSIDAVHFVDGSGVFHPPTVEAIAQMDRADVTVVYAQANAAFWKVDLEGKDLLTPVLDASDARLTELDREAIANNTDLLMGRPPRYKPQRLTFLDAGPVTLTIYGGYRRPRQFQRRT